MTRAASLQQTLERYGSETMVTVPGESPVTVRVMIQAMNYRNKVYLNDAWMPKGRFDNSHFFCTDPSDCGLDQMNSATLRCTGKEYKITRVQGFLVENRILYVWAALREPSEEETDGGV